MKTENRFKPWALESGATVQPLAFDLPVLYWGDLDDAQKETAISDCCVDADNADDYFYENNAQFVYLPAGDNNDATLFYLFDCLRLAGTEAGDHFDGYFSETAFSMVVLKLSGDGETCDLARIMG